MGAFLALILCNISQSLDAEDFTAISERCMMAV
jgi:hypothetical protein